LKDSGTDDINEKDAKERDRKIDVMIEEIQQDLED